MIRAAWRKLRAGWTGARTEQGVTILRDVKLYRDIRLDGHTFRGSDDEPSGGVDYLFDLFPPDAFRHRTVLDLGSAGGAICFEAAKRGARQATGIELDGRRIQGAWAIQRRLRCRAVRFQQQDLYQHLKRHAREPQDVVFALNILHHFSHPVPLLSALARAGRGYLCLETPENAKATEFREYGASLQGIEGSDLVTDVPGYLAYLKALHWEVIAERPSEQAKHFELADVTPRRVYLLRRRETLPDRATRWAEMALFLEHRERVHQAVLRDPHRLIISDGPTTVEQLRAIAPADRPANYLLLGPRASGKSHVFEQLPAGNRPAYNPKIFKFPNAAGLHGLARHFQPTVRESGRFAMALIGTADDARTHVSLDRLVEAVRGRAIVCVLVYCEAEEHFNRLYDREAAAWGTPHHDVWIDTALRFDYRRWIDAFQRHHLPYAVLCPASKSTDTAPSFVAPATHADR